MSEFTGSASGFKEIEDITEIPFAEEAFDWLREGDTISIDYTWTDPWTGVLMGERKIHAEVIAEWTRPDPSA